MSLDELMELQRTNIERYGDFQRNIQALSGKLTKEALDELAALGPGANSILQELINGGVDKWNEYNALYEEKARLAVDSAAGTVGDGTLVHASDQAISDAGTAVEQNDDLEAAFEDQAINSSEAFQEELNNADLPAFADETVEEIAAIIESNTAVEDAAVEIARRAYYAVENEVAGLGFWSIGEAIIQGMVEGIRNGISLIESAAREAARAAYEAARAELDIHSPSRKFAYLAQMSVKGYEEEMKSGEAVWGKALSQSMEGALAAMDTQRFQVASGYAASVVKHNTQTVSGGGDIVFEKGAIVVEGSPISNSLDADAIGRKIGDKAARQMRLRGGLVPG